MPFDILRGLCLGVVKVLIPRQAVLFPPTPSQEGVQALILRQEVLTLSPGRQC